MTDLPLARHPSADTTLTALVGFAGALRAADVVVGTGQEVAFARAVARLDVHDRDDVYWAGRACLVTRHDDIATYDRVFDAYFAGGAGTLTVSGTPRARRGVTAGQGTTVVAPRPRVTRSGERGMAASPWEVLRDKDFAACTPEELAGIRRLVEQLTLAAPRRRSRRTDRGPTGVRPDLRRALRDTIGEHARPGRPVWRRPRQKPRPLVLLLDVSGSMAAYSRVLLQFAWSARRTAGRVEVFCFGTRLTRVTPALARRDPDAALVEAARTVVDWDGGTRIGESVRCFLREHGRRAGCRGALVVICSDGLERGDPAVLAAQLARLRRLSHRVVWVNPLAGGAAFEPATRGMVAALPHVDALVAGHSLGSLEDLSAVLAELG